VSKSPGRPPHPCRRELQRERARSAPRWSTRPMPLLATNGRFGVRTGPSTEAHDRAALLPTAVGTKPDDRSGDGLD
jgi:hypothetical protein